MKRYIFNKNINGIKFKFDLDLRPHVLILTAIELGLVAIMIKYLISLIWG